MHQELPSNRVNTLGGFPLSKFIQSHAPVGIEQDDLHASEIAKPVQSDFYQEHRVFDINRAKFLDQFCYHIHASGMSCEIPLKAGKWLSTNMSIDTFKSLVPFPLAPVWDRGITKINVRGLASLGLNQARCEALQWGFDLGLTKLPPFQTNPPENYSSLLPYGDKVLQKLLKDAEKGVLEIFSPSKTAAYWFHPLGAVPKGTDDCRIVVDTSMTGLNDSINKSDMSLPSLSSILNSIKQGWVACTYDLTSGFYQLPLRQDMANFVCIRLPNGDCGRFRFICFGLKCAPFLFQGTMMDIRNLLIKHNIIECTILVYIDDFLLAAESEIILSQNREAFEKFMEWAGLLLNPDKKSEISSRFTVIGYEIDTADLWVSIPIDKFAKRRDLLDNLINTEICDWSTFQKVAGKLNHLAIVTPGGRHFMNPWWKIMKDTIQKWQLSNPKSSQPPPCLSIKLHNSEIKESLAWWQQVVKADKPPRRNIFVRNDGFLDVFSPDFFHLFGEQHGLHDHVLSYVERNIIALITSDASAVGGGWFFNNQQRGFSYMWGPSTAFASSNFRELLAVELACDSMSADWLAAIQGVWVRSDNITTVSALNKLRSDSNNIHESMKRISRWLIRHKIDIAATHIPGKLNTKADALSRVMHLSWDSLRIVKSSLKWLRQIFFDRCQLSYECVYFSSITSWDPKRAKSALAEIAHQGNFNNSGLLLVPHPIHATTMAKTWISLRSQYKKLAVLLPAGNHELYPNQPGPIASLLSKANFQIVTKSSYQEWFVGTINWDQQYHDIIAAPYECKYDSSIRKINSNQIVMSCVMELWVNKD